MNKLIIILSVLLLVGNMIFAQSIHLTTSNPEPRIDEEFEIRGKLVDEKANVRLTNVLDIRSIVRIPGASLIGPVSFIINGKKYESDSILVNIIEKLPKDTVGIWIRSIKLDDKNYLIIEQKLPVEWKQTSRNERTLSNDGFEFIEVKEDKLKENHLTFPNSSSHSSAGFKKFIYTYSKEEGFKPFLLTKKYFNNLPKGYKLKDVWIE